MARILPSGDVQTSLENWRASALELTPFLGLHATTGCCPGCVDVKVTQFKHDLGLGALVSIGSSCEIVWLEGFCRAGIVEALYLMYG